MALGSMLSLLIGQHATAVMAELFEDCWPHVRDAAMIQGSSPLWLRKNHEKCEHRGSTMTNLLQLFLPVGKLMTATQ
ncbi:DNA-binding protein [Sesbania bispinosa]|nr:DNA-binding protein [Sesbania bispinosa]